jgi:hypothetical protein
LGEEEREKRGGRDVNESKRKEDILYYEKD